jgi:beta-lactam-binding protein with PASTA domain
MNWDPRAIARRVWPYFAVSGGGFFLAYAIVGLFILPSGAGRADAPVPNVIGLPFDQAKLILSDSGFVPQRGEQRFESNAPAGSVVGQTPSPQAVLPRGARVVLDLSRGERTVEVPTISGLTQQQAELTLQSSNLDIGDVIAMDSPSPRGTVLHSFPAAGVRVPEASAITITVSAGPAMVTVPDVVGQSYASARSLLEQLGFQVGPAAEDSSSTAPSGTVIAQDPTPTRAVSAGATVTLTVANKP